MGIDEIKEMIGYQLNFNVMNNRRCSRCQHFSEANFGHDCKKYGILVAYFGCCKNFNKRED